MMNKVILLNYDFKFLHSISWKKAIVLMLKNKVEVIKYSTKKIKTSNNNIKEIVIPQIIKLVKLIRNIYKNKIPYTKKNILIRDNYKCLYCENKNNSMTIDHVIPISKGGKSSFQNCVCSCKNCNNKKKDRTPSEANMFLKYQPYQPTIMEFINIKMKNLGIYEILKSL